MWENGDKLLLIPAVRIDHHDSFGTHTSPKLGATYKLSENARVKANWGKGYRSTDLIRTVFPNGEGRHGTDAGKCYR